MSKKTKKAKPKAKAPVATRKKTADYWPTIERLSKAAKNKPITANVLASEIKVSPRRALAVLKHFATGKKPLLEAGKIVRPGQPGNHPVGFVRR